MTTATATPATEASTKIADIAGLAEAVQDLGYGIIETDEAEKSVSIVLPVGDENFVAILDISDDDSELVIESQIGKLADIPDNDTALALFMRLVSINSEIKPFATNIDEPAATDQISDLDESPITVIDSVPLGDFSREELEHSLLKLQSAINLTNLTMQAIISNG
tara:strand:- start:465871 stop:466365 length:495 start_codon:yes stop_codon:yes gene_type:complete